MKAYDTSEHPTRPANPEELIRVTKPITDATARAVSAGQSCQQDDVIVAANLARKVVSDLLGTCKVNLTTILSIRQLEYDLICRLPPIRQSQQTLGIAV